MSKIAFGAGEAAANKIKEYADRIINGASRESVIQGLSKSFVDDIDKLLAILKNKPEEEIIPEIEPEYEAGDYRKAYIIGRDFAQGKEINTPENRKR